MQEHSISLQEAIADFYRRAVTENATTSTQRLKLLAAYCVQQLEKRGLMGAEVEVTLPGGGRPKDWDVAWRLHGKYRLAISLKSILRNPGGTVPNRTDDLMGEVANVQMYSPEIVVGYIMIFDTSQDTLARRGGGTWSQTLKSRLGNLTGRSAPSWSIGMIEAHIVIEVDFSQEPRLITPEQDVEAMFDTLAGEVKKRNPGWSMAGA